jgi:hypothetical protein
MCRTCCTSGWRRTLNEWVVPVTHDERRYFVLDVPDSRIGNRAYFSALYDQMNNGGLAAMVYDLLRRDISTFDHRAIPKTQALAEQQKLSRDSLDCWWSDVLDRGFIWRSPLGVEKFAAWFEFATTHLLDSSYRQWCRDNNVSRLASRVILGKRFHEMYGPTERRRNEIIGEVERPLPSTPEHKLIITSNNQMPGYVLGPLEEARVRFAQVRNIDLDETD